jgi:hypothetical protein
MLLRFGEIVGSDTLVARHRQQGCGEAFGVAAWRAWMPTAA